MTFLVFAVTPLNITVGCTLHNHTVHSWRLCCRPVVAEYRIEVPKYVSKKASYRNDNYMLCHGKGKSLLINREDVSRFWLVELHVPAALFPWWQSWYPLYRGGYVGSRDRLDIVEKRKISVSVRNRTPAVLTRSPSLYQLSYPGSYFIQYTPTYQNFWSTVF
jgi:hypothetical protein